MYLRELKALQDNFPLAAIERAGYGAIWHGQKSWIGVAILARGRKPDERMDELLVLGDHYSDREQRAASAERELNKVKLLLYLSDKIGLELDGIITGVESYGLFITGVELPAEGFVHISSLTDDFYRYDRSGHVISGFRSRNSYRLGDTVRVAVAAVDVDARELDFRLIGRTGGPKAKGRVKPPPKSRGKKPARAHQPQKRKPKRKRSKRGR